LSSIAALRRAAATARGTALRVCPLPEL